MKILVVDDNASLARGIRAFLEEEGHDCLLAGCVKEGLELIKANTLDLIITDLKLPDGQGLQVIETARQAKAQVLPEVILMTAYGSVEVAAQAMKLGASDYLTKPVSMDELAFRVGKIQSFRQLELAHKRLLQDTGLDGALDEIAGNSTAISGVKELIKKVAPYPSTVLVTGETGVGKELVARAVHRLSSRCDGPFIRVNCASIPDTLFESELFGHEKGAFTDARYARAGCFEAASGGTVFLDEVGEIPVNLQAKLLRAVQEKEITRLGSNQARKIDVRIIAATNRNLEEMVAREHFREDLFYRLSVFKIFVPPLRERRDDVKDISLDLLKRLAVELNRGCFELSEAAVDALSHREWPGNIRELKNTLERAVVMANARIIEPKHLGFIAQVPRNGIQENSPVVALKLVGLDAALENFERDLIREALANNENVKSRAAEELKIPRTRLLYRMKKLGLAGD